MKFVNDRLKHERITAVLQNKTHGNTDEFFETVIMQQYFFTAASLKDIVRRYKNKNKDLVNFAEKVAIQLNDAHPAIGIVELMRIFIDEEGLTF